MDNKTTPASQTQTPLSGLQLAHGLEAKKVNCWFGTKHVLRDITMSIKPRQVTAIIGPSGCGKSTFIRCINRMHEVVPEARMEGQILLDGADIMELDPVCSDVASGWSFQKSPAFSHDEHL